MRYDMYVFEGIEPPYRIIEINGEEMRLIATFDTQKKAREVFRNLKRGNGFEGETPGFFRPLNYVSSSNV